MKHGLLQLTTRVTSLVRAGSLRSTSEILWLYSSTVFYISTTCLYSESQLEMEELFCQLVAETGALIFFLLEDTSVTEVWVFS